MDDQAAPPPAAPAKGHKTAARRRYGRAPARHSDLRELREARGWTIAEAVEWAAALGLRCTHRGTWKSWESGTNPTPVIVLRLLRGEVELVPGR